MIMENLSTLKIHKLTQAQYEREKAAGRLDENAIYLTPDTGGSGSGEGGELGELVSLAGANKKTLNINDCIVDTSADYAIVGGTNDKTVISNILGSLASTNVKVDKPIINADCGISFGSGTVVNSTGGNAIGVWNTSGIKGYYWDEINFANKTITITSTRRVSTLVNPTVQTVEENWEIGDIISLVNDSKYPAFAKITAISGNTITVDNLPFTKINYESKLSVFTYGSPDDRTIFACYEKSEVSGVNSRWYPRSGAVELGWAGTAFGVENLVTGSGGFVGGWNNWQAGDFGATFGRDNISSYSGLTAGMDNENITPCSAIFGTKNKAQYNPLLGNGNGNNLVCGENNITSAWNAAAIGRQLRATTNAQLVSGQFNKVTDERATFIVGNGNVTSDPVQEGDEVVDGYKVVRSNAFIVYHSGRIEAGKQTQSTDSDLTLVTNKYLKDSIASTIIPGLTKGNQTSGSNNVRIGINNTFEKFSSDAGMGTGTSCSESLIVGNGNQANGNQVFIAGYQNKVNVNQGVALGEGNKVTGAQGFAANFKNTVAGASGAAFGESNTVNGQNSAAFGLRNKVLVATGSSNNGKNNIIGGEDNTSSNWNNAAFGRCLDADTSALTVVGQFNKTPSARAMFIVGNGNVNITGVEQTTTTNQTETAYSRRNAFVAYYDGRCAVGAAPTEDMDVVNLAYLKNYLLDKEW